MMNNDDSAIVLLSSLACFFLPTVAQKDNQNGSAMVSAALLLALRARQEAEWETEDEEFSTWCTKKHSQPDLVACTKAYGGTKNSETG